MGNPPWEEPRLREGQHRCAECQKVIDKTTKYGSYDHKKSCSKYPGDPPLVKHAKEHGLIE